MPQSKEYQSCKVMQLMLLGHISTLPVPKQQGIIAFKDSLKKQIEEAGEDGLVAYTILACEMGMILEEKKHAPQSTD